MTYNEHETLIERVKKIGSCWQTGVISTILAGQNYARPNVGQYGKKYCGFAILNNVLVAYKMDVINTCIITSQVGALLKDFEKINVVEIDYVHPGAYFMRTDNRWASKKMDLTPLSFEELETIVEKDLKTKISGFASTACEAMGYDY